MSSDFSSIQDVLNEFDLAAYCWAPGFELTTSVANPGSYYVRSEDESVPVQEFRSLPDAARYFLEQHSAYLQKGSFHAIFSHRSPEHPDGHQLFHLPDARHAAAFVLEKLQTTDNPLYHHLPAVLIDIRSSTEVGKIVATATEPNVWRFTPKFIAEATDQKTSEYLSLIDTLATDYQKTESPDVFSIANGYALTLSGPDLTRIPLKVGALDYIKGDLSRDGLAQLAFDHSLASLARSAEHTHDLDLSR